MDLILTEEDHAFRAKARDWLKNNIPASARTAIGNENFSSTAGPASTGRRNTGVWGCRKYSR
jgi:hypothetical protein